MTILDDLRKRNQAKLARQGMTTTTVKRTGPTLVAIKGGEVSPAKPKPPVKRKRPTPVVRPPAAVTPRNGNNGGFAEPKSKKSRLLGQSKPSVQKKDSSKKPTPASSAPLPKRKRKAPSPNDAVSEYGGWCPDCKSGENVIQDSRGGRLVCTGCGLVVNNQLISDDAEWRNFSGSDNTGPDPNRVGAGFNVLKSAAANMLTFVDDDSRLSRVQKQQFSAKERKTVAAHDTIRKFANKLNLPQDISYCACDLYKQIVEAKSKSGKKPGILSGTGKKAPILCATVLYISAKAGSCPRPLNEVCQELGLDKGQICTCYGEIMKIKADGQLKLHKNTRRSNNSATQDFAVRYANKLRLPGNVVNASRLIVGEIEKIGFLSGRRPATVAAAAVYLATLESNSDRDRRTPTEISIVSHSAVSEIKTMYKELLTKKDRLLSAVIEIPKIRRKR